MNFSQTDVERIRAIALEIADIEATIAHLKRTQEAIEMTVQGEVAFDPTLKNEKQREFKAWESLAANEAYSATQAELQANQHQRQVLLAELEYSRNSLSVRKLAQKTRIANSLLGHEQADLAA